MKTTKSLIIIAILGCLVPLAYAFTVNQSERNLGNGVVEVRLDWSGGNVTATTIPAKQPDGSSLLGRVLYSVVTNPGSTAPTALYDIVINDVDGIDVSRGLLANRSATASEQVYLGNGTAGPPMVMDDLSFVLTHNQVGNATGVVKLIFK